MTQSADWEIVRHHVSICGQVLDVDGNPMADIQLSALPDATPSQARAGGFRRESGKVRKDAASQVLRQIRKTESRQDGMFFFLDCPDGKYTISARDLRSRMRAQKSISVAATAMKKRMKDRGTEEGYQIELVLKK